MEEVDIGYENHSKIAQIKILLLKYGVNFEPKDIFNKFKDIENYKTKYRVVKPVNENFQVYDTSKDKTLIPSEILISNNKTESIVKLRYSENSPLTIKVDNGEIYIELYGVREKVNISLVKKNDILKEKIPVEILDTNRRIGDYIDIVGIDRVSILFFEGCYNWIVGKPCKFCDLHPKKDDSNTVKPTLNKFKNFNFDVKTWWNKYKEEYLKGLSYSLNKVIKENNLNHIHIFFMAGNLPTNTDVWDVAEETIQYLSKTLEINKFDNYLNIAPHDTIERLERINKLGIKQVQYNLEVVNEENFKQTCPGKMPYNEFLYKLKEAVTVFKKGNVRSNFVLGLDDLNETLEFAEKIAKEGIVFDYSVFQPKKCTPYSNRNTPDFDKVVEFTEALVEIYKKNNFKPIFCPLSSRSSLVNELYDEKE